MANDPGRNNDGPPDLDEVLRQLSRKINSIFGVKPKLQSSPNADEPHVPVLYWCGSRQVFILSIKVLAVWYYASGNMLKQQCQAQDGICLFP
jgi:hypothetical protein